MNVVQNINRVPKREAGGSLETYKRIAQQVQMEMDYNNYKLARGGAFSSVNNNMTVNISLDPASIMAYNADIKSPNQNEFKHVANKNKFLNILNENLNKPDENNNVQPKVTTGLPKSPYPHHPNILNNHTRRLAVDNIEQGKLMTDELLKENMSLKKTVEELKKRIDLLETENRNKELKIKEYESKLVISQEPIPSFRPRSKSPLTINYPRPTTHRNTYNNKTTNSNAVNTSHHHHAPVSATSRQNQSSNPPHNSPYNQYLSRPSSNYSQAHNNNAINNNANNGNHYRHGSPMLPGHIMANLSFIRHGPIGAIAQHSHQQAQQATNRRRSIQEERKSANESLIADENSNYSYRIHYEEDYHNDTVAYDGEAIIHGHNNSPFSGDLSFNLHNINPDNMTYEELLQLGERIGFVSKGLTAEQIKKIPKAVHVKKIGIKDEDCPICLSEFENSCKYRTLPCSHKYHSKCIKKWLTSGKNCPICKKEVTV